MNAPIRVFDSTFALVAEIDNYESAYYERSWSGAGQFEIKINFNIPQAELIAVDGYVQIENDDYKIGIITEIHLAEGPNGKGDQIMTVKGREAKWVYSRRIVIPTAGQTNYYLKTTAESCLKTIAKYQAGANASDTKRSFGSLITYATDQSRGPEYIINSRYKNLYEEMQACAAACSMGWYLKKNNGGLTFDVALGLDRTAGQIVNPSAVFATKYDTMQSSTVTVSDVAYRNVAYSAGQGVGSGRTVNEVWTESTEPEGLRRREVFIDARDLSASADVTDRGEAKLAQMSAQIMVDGKILPKSELVYQQDYDLGDIVTISSYGVDVNTRITQVRESWGPNQYDIALTFDRKYPEFPETVTDRIGTINNAVQSTEGVIIESGSNANGSWRKFSDGTMECFHEIPWQNASTSLGGGLYASTLSWTFPVTFYSIRTIEGTAFANGANQNAIGCGIDTRNTTTSSCRFYGIGNVINQPIGVCASVYGRWRA